MQIDLLKASGLLLIVLAHINPGFFLMQFRAFDVSLMVLISGYLAQASYAREESLISYYKKRVLRLYIPTVLFLTFFFLFFYFAATPCPFSRTIIVRSYALLFYGTINYVWIIRVFLLCALMVPLLIFLQNRLFSKRGAVILIGVYAFYEYAVNTMEPPELFRETFFYATAYGIILVLGMFLHRFSGKEIYWLSAIFGAIYCIIAAYLYCKNGHYISVQEYKYPPRLYYLSYSAAVSYFLFAVTKNIRLNDGIYAFIRFLSRSSLSIYLWHIFFLYLLEFNNVSAPWPVLYICILFPSCTMSYLTKTIMAALFYGKSRKKETHLS